MDSCLRLKSSGGRPRPGTEPPRPGGTLTRDEGPRPGTESPDPGRRFLTRDGRQTRDGRPRPGMEEPGQGRRTLTQDGGPRPGTEDPDPGRSLPRTQDSCLGGWAHWSRPCGGVGPGDQVHLVGLAPWVRLVPHCRAGQGCTRRLAEEGFATSSMFARSWVCSAFFWCLLSCVLAADPLGNWRSLSPPGPDPPGNKLCLRALGQCR